MGDTACSWEKSKTYVTGSSLVGRCRPLPVPARVTAWYRWRRGRCAGPRGHRQRAHAAGERPRLPRLRRHLPPRPLRGPPQRRGVRRARGGERLPRAEPVGLPRLRLHPHPGDGRGRRRPGRGPLRRHPPGHVAGPVRHRPPGRLPHGPRLRVRRRQDGERTGLLRPQLAPAATGRRERPQRAAVQAHARPHPPLHHLQDDAAQAVAVQEAPAQAGTAGRSTPTPRPRAAPGGTPPAARSGSAPGPACRGRGP